MTKKLKKSDSVGKRPIEEKKVQERSTAEIVEGDCRCVEASRKTPQGLLKMMLGDLAFWKKRK